MVNIPLNINHPIPEVLHDTAKINDMLKLINKDIFDFVLNDFGRISNVYLAFLEYMPLVNTAHIHNWSVMAHG